MATLMVVETGKVFQNIGEIRMVRAAALLQLGCIFGPFKGLPGSRP
jgi:hypothetical protein